MLGDRVKNFFAREHHPHRPAGFLRQRHGNRLDLRIDLAAVAAAEIRHDHAHFRDRNFENIGQLRAHDERILRRRPDRDPSAGLDRSDAGVGFEKTMLRRRQREGVFENMIRFGEAFVDVAAIESEMRAQVGPFDRL